MFKIIGAGVAGITAAARLSELGKVNIIERRSKHCIFNSGAGFILWPNGTKIIHASFPSIDVKLFSVHLKSIESYSKDNKLLNIKDLSPIFNKFGAYPLSVDRASFISQLYSYTLKTSENIEFFFDNQVEHRLIANNLKTPTLVCSGIKSKIFNSLKINYHPLYAGVYNFIGVSPNFFQNNNIGKEYLGNGSRVGFMPLPNNKIYYRYSVCLPKLRFFSDPKEYLKYTFSFFPDFILEHIDNLEKDKILVRPEMTSNNIPNTENIRLAILGDALCPMTSGTGQGVSQALEDSFLIYHLIKNKGFSQKVLDCYYSERLPRRKMIREESLRVTEMMSLNETEYNKIWANEAVKENGNKMKKILSIPNNIMSYIE
jgi:2-polyprenyl-6-methoxyphenol hydroxylase-like FAD-dependent oxidoreductase